jgi:serine carboxypeptidase 1
VDADGYQKIHSMAKRTERAFEQGNFALATDMWALTETILEEETGAIDFYNVQYDIQFRGKNEGSLRSALIQTLSPREFAFEIMVNRRQSEVLHPVTFRSAVSNTLDDDIPAPLTLNQMMRNVVHPKLKLPANVTFGSQSNAVFNTLAGDFMKPVVDYVEKTLNETSINVIVYNGQLDLICSTPGTIAWVNRMDWKHKKEYMSAPRDGISVNGILEGYVRKYDKFHMYWVRHELVIKSHKKSHLNFISFLMSTHFNS